MAETFSRTISPYDGEPLPPDQQAYKAKSGKMLIKPSIELVEMLDAEGAGFCLNCGAHDQSAEPDMRKGQCEVCGEPKLYGAAEIALMGLAF